jgi:hypothetical protein
VTSYLTFPPLSSSPTLILFFFYFDLKYGVSWGLVVSLLVIETPGSMVTEKCLGYGAKMTTECGELFVAFVFQNVRKCFVIFYYQMCYDYITLHLILSNVKSLREIA